MTTAEKLVIIAENEQKVYDAGKKAEYDAFWDEFQDKGNRTDYRYAFAYGRWTDKNYNPKYPIKIDGFAYAMSMFDYTDITDTKVDIELLNTSTTNVSVFSNAKKLVTIPKLTLGGNKSFNGWFTNANALTNIEIGGSIDVTFAIYHTTVLTKESIVSIIEHLLSTATGQTVTLSKKAVNNAFGINIDDESTYPEGSEWYVLRNSKSNWTFNFV